MVSGMAEEEIEPVVYASTREHETRVGRGFSYGEIERAGLSLGEARQLEIPVDKRRKTTHSENIQKLKELLKISIPLHEIRGIGKVVEEELKQAGVSDTYDLSNVDTRILAEKVPHSEKTLKKWKSEAKRLLKKQMKG